MGHLKVLLVEDKESIREYVKYELENRFGAVVEEASTGTDGLKALKQSEFRFVISDSSMPNGDGVHILNYLERNPDLSTTLIMFTADEKVLTSKDWQARAVLVEKPNFEELVETIDFLMKDAFQFSGA